MLTLAIEIGNPTAQLATPGVAIGILSPAAPPQLLGLETIAPSARHDDDLMPAIDRLTRRLGLSPRELQAVAVSVGPGGYTALRIAVATGSMIAHATGATPIAVPTALAAAHALEPSITGTIGVALASKNETAAIARFRADHGLPPNPIDLPGEIRTADTLAGLGLTHLVADQFLPETFASAAANLGIQRVPLKLDPIAVLRAASWTLDHASSPSTLPLLAPLYLREPDAVTLWRQRQTSSR